MTFSKGLLTLLALSAASLPVNCLPNPSDREILEARAGADDGVFPPTAPPGSDPAHQAGYIFLDLELFSRDAVDNQTKPAYIQFTVKDVIRAIRGNSETSWSPPTFFSAVCQFQLPGLKPSGIRTNSYKADPYSNVTIDEIQWPKDPNGWTACNNGGYTQVRAYQSGSTFRAGVQHTVVGNDTSVPITRTLDVPIADPKTWFVSPRDDTTYKPVHAQWIHYESYWPTTAKENPNWKGEKVPVSRAQLLGTKVTS